MMGRRDSSEWEIRNDMTPQTGGANVGAPVTGASFGTMGEQPFYGGAMGVAEQERERMAMARDRASVERAQAMEAQHGALGQYERILRGEAPSVAELQLQQGGEANVRAALAMAQAGRGGNMAQAGRMGAMGAAGANMELNQQTALLRAHEQQAALQGYAGLGTTMAEQAGGRQMGYEQLGQNVAMGQMDAGTQMAMARMDAAQRAQALELERRKYDTARNFGIFDRAYGASQDVMRTVGSLAGGMGGM